MLVAMSDEHERPRIIETLQDIRALAQVEENIGVLFRRFNELMYSALAAEFAHIWRIDRAGHEELAVIPETEQAPFYDGSLIEKCELDSSKCFRFCDETNKALSVKLVARFSVAVIGSIVIEIGMTPESAEAADAGKVMYLQQAIGYLKQAKAFRH